jgi:hypothetical protein
MKFLRVEAGISILPPGRSLAFPENGVEGLTGLRAAASNVGRLAIG